MAIYFRLMRLFFLLIFLSPVLLPTSLLAQCEFTISPVESEGCMRSEAEAVYTDLVNAEVDGNTVKRLNGNWNWNSGAFTTAGIYDKGYVQTTINQTNKSRIFGLSHANNANNNAISTMEYGIVFQFYGLAEIRESGSYKAYLGQYSLGDIFKIALEDGAVNYYKNGTLLYTSEAAPTLPLKVDLAFQHAGAKLSDIRIVNTTGTTLQAKTDQGEASVTNYNWYRNSILLTETASEITLDTYSENDIISCSAIPVLGDCAGYEIESNRLRLSSDDSAVPDNGLVIENIADEQGCYLAREDVLWKANIPENIEIDGNDVTKVAGYTTSNGGFYSSNVVHNNGYLEFQKGETNSRKMVGLSNSDNGSNESTIQYAFYMTWGGSLRIYENGSWQGQFGSAGADDILRIAVEDNVVKYYRNEELLYVSDQTPNLPLIADGTIQSSGASIEDARIANPSEGIFVVNSELPGNADLTWTLNGQSLGETGTTLSVGALSENDEIACSYISTQVGCGEYEVESNIITILANQAIADQLLYIEGISEQAGEGLAEEEVVWNPQSLANVSNIENTLTKIQGYNQYNAGASSLNTVKNNGYLTYTVSQSNKTKAIGLSHTDPNYNYSSTDYAILLRGNGNFTIRESGGWIMGNQNYAVGDNFRIAVESNVVNYYKNEALIYSSTVNPTLPLHVDVSLKSEGSRIENARVANPNNRKFKANYSGLGSAPEIEWIVNGNPTGNYSNPGILEGLSNEDIVTCSILPDFSGCGEQSSFVSNEIRFLGPVTQSHWTGEVSSAWANPANWTQGVPTAEISGIIPGGRPHQPVISSGQSVKAISIEQNASLSFANAPSLLVYGNFLINGTLNPGDGTVTFNGSEDRKIAGEGLTLNRLIVNLSQPNESIKLESTISIAKEILFLRGKIKTRSELVIYLNGCESRPGNAESFIEGKARKIGDTEFLFPIGSGDKYAPVEISAPDAPSDSFTAEYIPNDPNDDAYNTESQDGSLNTISTCEYWNIERTHGQSDVRVTLSYANNRSCGVGDPSYLQVVHWNGSEWENEGMSTFEGDTIYGTVTGDLYSDDFSPFTLGSLSGIHPLPIELVSFSAYKAGSNVNLEWTTASERNNSHFVLERSSDASNFIKIGDIAGAGTSHEPLEYQFTDRAPQAGTNYYRLSQIDFDGQKTYFDIQSVQISSAPKLTIYPNPNKGSFKIQRENEDSVTLQICDIAGRVRWELRTDQRIINIAIPQFENGVYFLTVNDGRVSRTEKVIIR